MAKDIGHVALSTQQVIGVLLIIASLGLGAGAVSEFDYADRDWLFHYRLFMGIATGLCALASAGCFLWHVRRVSQPDIHPDILAEVVGEDNVTELDSLHFWSAGRQSGPTVRVIILLQNVYAAAVEGRLVLRPVGTTAQIRDAAKAWEFNLGPAEVIAAWRDMPVPAARELSFGIDGFIRKVRAPRIRFQRHIAIRPQTSGSRININVTPPEPSAQPPVQSGPWEALSLWSPQEPRTAPQIVKLLSHVFAQ